MATNGVDYIRASGFLAAGTVMGLLDTGGRVNARGVKPALAYYSWPDTGRYGRSLRRARTWFRAWLAVQAAVYARPRSLLVSKSRGDGTRSIKDILEP